MKTVIRKQAYGRPIEVRRSATAPNLILLTGKRDSSLQTLLQRARTLVMRRSSAAVPAGLVSKDEDGNSSRCATTEKSVPGCG